MTDIIELAKQWLDSDEGKHELKDAMESVERMTRQLQQAREIPPHLMHQPFVPVLTKFAQLLQQGEVVAEPKLSSWWAVIMETAASYETSSYSIKDIDEKNNAINAIEYARRRANELWNDSKKQTTPPDTQQKLDKAREALQFYADGSFFGSASRVAQQALKDIE